MEGIESEGEEGLGSEGSMPTLYSSIHRVYVCVNQCVSIRMYTCMGVNRTYCHANSFLSFSLFFFFFFFSLSFSFTRSVPKHQSRMRNQFIDGFDMKLSTDGFFFLLHARRQSVHKKKQKTEIQSYNPTWYVHNNKLGYNSL